MHVSAVQADVVIVLEQDRLFSQLTVDLKVRCEHAVTLLKLLSATCLTQERDALFAQATFFY